MNYKTEFPNFDDTISFDGFRDTSWHNDVCPSFHYDLGHGVGIRVWVDYKDKSLRESQDHPRFSVDLMQDDESIDYPIVTTDSLEELLATIEKLKVEFANLSAPLIVRT